MFTPWLALQTKETASLVITRFNTSKHRKDASFVIAPYDL